MGDLSKIETIMRMVAEKEGVVEHTIASDRRSKRIVHARYVTFYLIYILTNYSMPAIGRMFSKDHTTILHGIRKIETERKKDPVFDSTLRHYESVLGHNHHLKSPDLEEKKIILPLAT